MHDNNRPNFTTIILIICVLALLAALVIICARNPGGGALLSMAVYTRSTSVRVKRRRRPGCCCVWPLALSAAYTLCVLAKLVGVLAVPWLVVLAPALLVVAGLVLFYPREH